MLRVARRGRNHTSQGTKGSEVQIKEGEWEQVVVKMEMRQGWKEAINDGSDGK